MIGIPLGLLYANAGEWVIHKRLLHGRGRDKKSMWSFHFHDHHNLSRKNDMADPMYDKLVLKWDPATKELVGLFGLGAAHLPLLPIAPFFTGAIMYSLVNYYRLHKKSHLDAEWAKENLPWHYDHHMGPDQDMNWCVTKPFFDWVMGTREKYYGTERYVRDENRRKARRGRGADARHAERAAPSSGEVAA